MSNGFEQNALAVACDYFGDDDEERNKAVSLVRRLGITDDAINEQASQDNLHILSALERLMGNRQSRRDTIVSEYQRRKRKAQKRSGSEPRAPRSRAAGCCRRRRLGPPMATDKQIAANRANCKRSTGPRTAAGQSKSSRNGFRYGLSLPLSVDPQTQAKIEALAEAVAGDSATAEQLGAARECSTPGTDAHSKRLRPSHVEAFNPGDRSALCAAAVQVRPLRTAGLDQTKIRCARA